MEFADISDSRNSVPEESDVWFYAKGADRFGPFSYAHLTVLAKEGGLDPRLDLVWRTGMADWLPAGEVEGLFERRAPAPGTEPAALSPSGAAVWAQAPGYDEAPMPRAKYPGTGRFGYFFWLAIVLPLLAMAFGFAFPTLRGAVGEGYAAWLPAAFLALAGLLALGVVLARLRNVGMSGWWLPGFLVPVLNLWLGYRLFACPPGYAAVGKLDGIGVVLAIVYWLGLAASVALGIAAAAAGTAEWQDSKEWHEILETLRSVWQRGHSS